jgi:hypothetical protein
MGSQRQAERLQRAAAMNGLDQRLTNLEGETNDIARLTTELIKTLDDGLKALQLKNHELRTLIHKLETTVTELQAKRSRRAKSGTVIDLPAMRVAQ